MNSNLTLTLPKSNGRVAGSLVVDISAWATHSLTSYVFAILAQEVVSEG